MLKTFLFFAIVFVSFFGSFSSVYLTIYLKLKACPLCLYQRAFIIGVFLILILSIINGANQSSAVLTALALTSAGGVIAAFHYSLVARQILECPSGLWGIGSAPLQSLICYLLLIIFQIAYLVTEISTPKLLIALFLGILSGVFCLKSSPPLPPLPKDPYPVAIDTCRPPYRP